MKPIKMIQRLTILSTLCSAISCVTPQSGDCKIGDCHNGSGSKSYPDGVYDGDFRGSFRAGNGLFQYTSGDRYIGQWRKDMPNGTGTLSSGRIRFIGTFVDGIRHGTGTLIYPSRIHLRGHWVQGALEGEFTLSIPGKCK